MAELIPRHQAGGVAPRIKPTYEEWIQSLPERLRNDQDYDLRGYFNRHGFVKIEGDTHLNDEFKKPNHVTFSNESIYSNKQHPGGQWSGDDEHGWSFTPTQFNIDNVGLDSLKNYFKLYEPNSKLVLPKPNKQRIIQP